jgi:hypothetical protein
MTRKRLETQDQMLAITNLETAALGLATQVAQGLRKTGIQKKAAEFSNGVGIQLVVLKGLTTGLPQTT